MKKLTLFFFALLAVCLAFQACDNSKTYAETVSYTHLTLPTT